MPCAPTGFLNLAKRLSSGSDEIEWQCAISRAYYTALHWADKRKALCSELHLDIVHGGSHGRIIERFRRHNASVKAQQIGYILQDMRNKRESADYALGDSFIANDGFQQIVTAQRVKRMLDEFAAVAP